jgi:manganese transport protein
MTEHVIPLPTPSRLQQLQSRGRLRGTLAMLGPAFVACIAYVDPGNFATNIAGGARYGYLLLWVLLSANLMAMLIQNLSAKIGIATGRNLAELCRDHFPRPVAWGLWIQAELIAMATDLAEFVGAAIALNLLFHVPLFSAGLITAVVERPPRASSRASRGPTRCCWRPPSSAPRSCRT